MSETCRRAVKRLYHVRDKPRCLLDKMALARVPVEIVVASLHFLDDVRSLQAAVVSHRIFYNAFQADPSILVTLVENIVPQSLFPLALAVLKSGAAGSMSKEETVQLLDEHLPGGTTPPKAPLLSLAAALQIADFHAIVRSFSEEFLAYSISHLGSLGGPVSTSEELRICRAFYRFQLYHHLFRELPQCFKTFSYNEQRDSFFDPYSPWVNEQLVSVHEFSDQKFSMGRLP